MYNSMVKNVWNVTDEKLDNAQRSVAGGKEVLNSRDMYKKQNVKNTPFGTSQVDSASKWGSSNRTNYGQSGEAESRTAGGATKQFAFV